MQSANNAKSSASLLTIGRRGWVFCFIRAGKTAEPGLQVRAQRWPLPGINRHVHRPRDRRVSWRRGDSGTGISAWVHIGIPSLDQESANTREGVSLLGWTCGQHLFAPTRPAARSLRGGKETPPLSVGERCGLHIDDVFQGLHSSSESVDCHLTSGSTCHRGAG